MIYPRQESLRSLLFKDLQGAFVLNYLLSFCLYFAVLLSIGLLACYKQKSKGESLTGSRSLSYWVTAISAHASDMSSWLFMGFPAAVLKNGLSYAWVAVALTGCMFLNWHFVAPKIRQKTEEYSTFTIAGYFAARFPSKKSALTIVAAVITLFYFSIYVSAGFLGFGLLFQSLFNIPFIWGMSFGISAVVLYTCLGGFVAVAWTDFFQGVFLLFVIILVPFCAIYHTPEVTERIVNVFNSDIFYLSSSNGCNSLFSLILVSVGGWGFGYFGQPHILNKFMGIADPKELNKAKILGTCWQILTLAAATTIGIVALGFYEVLPSNRDLIFIEMVKIIFNPFLAGFILCAILAATISTVDSQLIVLSSVITEDFYQKTLHPKASQKTLRFVSRASIILITIISFIIALLIEKYAGQDVSIFDIVEYSWAGLGAAFGPLLLLSLYRKEITGNAALAGVSLGGIIPALWPLFFTEKIKAGIPFELPKLLAASVLSTLAILLISRFSKKNEWRKDHKDEQS
jgi:sodium/proline symporter